MQYDSFWLIGVRQIFKFFFENSLRSTLNLQFIYSPSSLAHCCRVLPRINEYNSNVFKVKPKRRHFTLYSLIVLCNLFSIHQKIFFSNSIEKYTMRNAFWNTLVFSTFFPCRYFDIIVIYCLTFIFCYFIFAGTCGRGRNIFGAIICELSPSLIQKQETLCSTPVIVTVIWFY